MEFEYLMLQEKVFDDLSSTIALGPAPIQWSRQLNAFTSKETFLLDFSEGALNFQSTQ